MQLSVTKEGLTIGSLTIHGPIEVGRREESDPIKPLPFETVNPNGVIRWVVADLDSRRIPRKVCSITPFHTSRCRVTNIHTSNRELFVTDGSPLPPGQSVDLPLPAVIRMPEGLCIEVRASEGQSPQPAANALGDPWNAAMQTILGSSPGPHSVAGSQFQNPLHTLTEFSSPTGASGQIDVPTVLGWIEQAIAALQYPVNSPTYFSGVAQTVVSIIDLDVAEIVLWNGEDWEFSESRRFVKPNLRHPYDSPSVTLLKKALETKQLVIHPDSTVPEDSFSSSLFDLHTAIASPILDVFDEDRQLLGVLYAARRRTSDMQRPATVLEPERKLVAILSTAVASSIARMKRERLVAKYQQFFSSKVTEAISQNPALLEGEDADVSVLFCDIRGFSKATDIIGAKAAMSWISDTLSELSSIVLDSDGVLVDYVGDEMFAMWGAPEKSFEHAFRAASAARSMMSLRHELNARYAGKLPSKVDFGIGVCTGPARVGNTGSKQKFKYGPMGRTVNLGSRIQGLTKQWGVSTIIDASTADCLPKDIAMRRLCRAQVVGMDGDIDLYQLMSEEENDPQLIAGYHEALEMYESGCNMREAAKAFGELVQKFPNDSPSLILLDRSVHELVNPAQPFNPIWCAKSK